MPNASRFSDSVAIAGEEDSILPFTLLRCGIMGYLITLKVELANDGSCYMLKRKEWLIMLQQTTLLLLED